MEVTTPKNEASITQEDEATMTQNQASSPKGPSPDLDTEASDGADSYEVVFERGFEHIANFHSSQSLDDISQAIVAFKQAIVAFKQANDISPNSRPLVNMANALFRRFELTGNTRDLDDAITTQQKGIAFQTEANAVSLNNLGRMLRLRFERLSFSDLDLEDALQAFRDVMATEGTKPNILLESARSYAELSFKHRGVSSALVAYKFAMDLIPRISTAGRQLMFRYAWIPNIRETVNGAVAAAIEVGDLELSLEWFEKGRCVVWGQILQLRTPLDDLRRSHPALAEEVEKAMEQLSIAEETTEKIRGQSIQTPGRDEIFKRGRESASRLDELVQDVRRLDGFHNFMQSNTVKELRSAAVHGPIVSLNVSPNRCDALVLFHSSDSVIHVPLPDLTYDTATKLQSDFQRVLNGSGVQMRFMRPHSRTKLGSMGPTLSMLWSHVVEPILKKIGYLETTRGAQLSRITWCPSGVLSSLPLHAAGIYSLSRNRSDSPKVFDFVISSYAPSISSLLGAVRKHDAVEHIGPKILAISQPATPKHTHLPGTVDEITAIQDVVGAEKMTWLNDAQATTSSVLELMRKHAWVHLACHGIQDSDAPTQSAFMLHDGGVDLRAIMQLSFDKKELAVLSACQTATGDNALPDESVHLAAGMLMAGYPSVVGTLWSIGDSDAPIVMERFYSYLINEAKGDSGCTAYALHHAVGVLREKVGERDFIKWVPFVHFGI
ncbi:CHAT domain-containing protein [Amylostereum chailletii]|nr:CHAT domain-containing protein [Amylostereum chailletii]